MEGYWESSALAAGLNYDNSTDSDIIPNTEEPVYILGESYSALYDRDEINHDILSRIWVTYRKGFPPIGAPSGPTSDTGWGCMHRCGQMMLAQTLVHIHLGRKWRWYRNTPNPVYDKILSMFHDSKGAMLSIHQIASMGVSEGKKIGKWFGPNTVSQVLKKLCAYDRWTNLVVHVSLEDGVIIDEIKSLCRQPKKQPPSYTALNHFHLNAESRSNLQTDSPKRKTSGLISKELDDDCVEVVLPPVSSANNSNCSTPRTEHVRPSPHEEFDWKPLLLVIPLRLGLSEMNDCYIPSIKRIFTLPQCVGIIGGRPSHALWFIGSVENDLLYLDPHTTQPAMPSHDITLPENDESYHCVRPGRIAISKVDPSLAIGFVCTSEKSFTDLCENLSRYILTPVKDPLFEIHQRRPPHLPPLSEFSSTNKDSKWPREPMYDSDEDFELI